VKGSLGPNKNVNSQTKVVLGRDCTLRLPVCSDLNSGFNYMFLSTVVLI